MSNKYEGTKIRDFVYLSNRQRFQAYDTDGNLVKEDSFTIPEKFERVIYSDKYTIVMLNDGSKGVAKCMDGDSFNETTGVKIAYLRAKIKSLQKELKGITGKDK